MNQEIISKLRFDDKGLIPAVVQDFYTGEVLTVAYMNEESLKITLDEKMTCFWSRSRQELWRKGETSGNRQHIVSVTTDCDCDAIVVKVIKDGPACHTGSESCFFNLIYRDAEKNDFSIDALYDLIKGRKTQMQEGSYTTYLFSKGLDKIMKKVGEECTEVIIGAAKHSKEETIYEISDLAYHILVLMVEMGISVDDIRKELDSRHVIDHKVKQETMQ
ncbi:MAG: bifunctional phosphoribosyl-AMP cyclohydrolase/phosphoribosyl-ATP diphosphatase HisIE [Clostridia bacterium]|nr:bifunctional phosphoribosyl-AMP cyclohydrolase/phosphoribosyl-ATP diphosphatase HisIE [Clostridia bacterium]